MNLVVADSGPLLDRVLGLTYDIWNEGLRLLATAKRYRYHVRLDGRSGWMAGIGAVFTPPPYRGQGYASQLIERLLEMERRDGVLLAGLFSEIGTPFYERLGFAAVPIDEVTVHVDRKDGAPAMLVRVGDDRDLPALEEMHRVRSSNVRFAIDRDRSMIHYALSKKRMLAGLGPVGLRQVEFVVAEEGASAVAYAVLHENANGWTLEEAGDRDPSGARLGAMLQVLVAREPSAPIPLIRAWWPQAFPVPPQLTLTDRSAARDVFMVRPLADIAMPENAEDVFYWHSDHF
jgi:GNAT superfamily N-acetyltransferase